MPGFHFDPGGRDSVTQYLLERDVLKLVVNTSMRAYAVPYFTRRVDMHEGPSWHAETKLCFGFDVCL
jgi:hypothetical protein